MRLFAAIDVPDTVKDHLAFLQRNLDEVPQLRLTHPKNIHLTLSFLGDEHPTEQVITELKKISFSTFQLRLKGTGFFPSKDSPRVVWVGLEDCEALKKLQRDIDYLFTPTKSFKPHLTLARLKPKALSARIVRAVEDLEVKPISFKVTAFKLYKTTLTSVGPIYHVLETYKPTTEDKKH